MLSEAKHPHLDSSLWLGMTEKKCTKRPRECLRALLAMLSEAKHPHWIPHCVRNDSAVVMLSEAKHQHNMDSLLPLGMTRKSACNDPPCHAERSEAPTSDMDSSLSLGTTGKSVQNIRVRRHEKREVRNGAAKPAHSFLV